MEKYDPSLFSLEEPLLTSELEHPVAELRVEILDTVSKIGVGGHTALERALGVVWVRLGMDRINPKAERSRPNPLALL